MPGTVRPPNAKLRVGAFEIDSARNIIIGTDGASIHVEPKIIELLMQLAAHPGEVLSRDHLIETVWNGAYGADPCLSATISRLRRIFDDSPARPDYIETISKRGYRLIAPVEIRASAEAALPASDGIKAPATPDAKPVPALNRGRRTRRRILGWGGLAILLIAASGSWIAKDGNEGTAPDLAAVSSSAKSIAVLPLTSVGDSPEDEYFADGLSEELIDNLAKLPPLRVAGRTSSFYFKGQQNALRDVQAALGVDYVLEGNVRRAEGRLRVTVRLLDVTTGFALWSEIYDRDASDIFEVQQDIARAVTAQLRIQLGTDDDDLALHRWTSDPDAYEAYLKGLAHFRRNGWTLKERRNVGQLRLAWRAFGDAIARDPDFAPAHARLALSYLFLSLMTGGKEIAYSEAATVAQRHVQTALGLAPELSVAHLANGFLLQQKALRNVADMAHELDLAEAAYERALALDASNYEALVQLAYLSAERGDGARAIAFLERASQSEPLAREVLLAAGRQYTWQYRLDEARETLDRLNRFYPDFAEGFIARARLESVAGRFDRAVPFYEAVLRTTDHPFANFDLGLIYLSLGDRATGYRHLERAYGGDWTVMKRLFEGDYEGLHAAFEKMIGSQPNPAERLLLGAVLMSFQTARDDDMFRYLERLDPTYSRDDLAPAKSGQHLGRYLMTAVALGKAGEVDRARQRMDAALAFIDGDSSETGWLKEIKRTAVLANSGRRDEAIAALRAAVTLGWRKLYNPFWWGEGPHIRDDRMFGPLLDDPEFRAIIDEVETDNAATLARLRARPGE